MDFQALFLTNDGRINRQPYWMGVLVLVVVNLVAGLLIGLIFRDSAFGHILSLIVAVALIYPSINIGIKRFHDRDKSGWWVLICLVPLIGPIWYLIECGFLSGTPGPNRFGPDPLK